MSIDNDNLFDDVPTAGQGEGDSKEFNEPNDQNAQTSTVKKAEEGNESGEEGQTGEKTKTDGTPPEGEKGDQSSNDNKMIPEHRFKAALKDVQDKLDAVMAENATLKAQPAPDREKDPEGFALHTRMEASKAVMREFKPDYDEVIKHYVEMAKVNPELNERVAAAALPAKFAYDLAKRDLEIRDLMAMKDSDEYKEFQEFKKSKAEAAKAAEGGNEQNKTSQQVTKSLTSRVPNLNRATDVSKANAKSSKEDEDEYLFGDVKY